MTIYISSYNNVCTVKPTRKIYSLSKTFVQWRTFYFELRNEKPTQKSFFQNWRGYRLGVREGLKDGCKTPHLHNSLSQGANVFSFLSSLSPPRATTASVWLLWLLPVISLLLTNTVPTAGTRLIIHMIGEVSCEPKRRRVWCLLVLISRCA